MIKVQPPPPLFVLVICIVLKVLNHKGILEILINCMIHIVVAPRIFSGWSLKNFNYTKFNKKIDFHILITKKKKHPNT